MRLKLNLTRHAKAAYPTAVNGNHSDSLGAPARFRPFLVPLGDDPLAHVKPWAAPARAAFLVTCISLTWAIPIGAWLLF